MGDLGQDRPDGLVVWPAVPLRTPITAIRGLSIALATRAGEMNAEQRRRFPALIAANAERVAVVCGGSQPRLLPAGEMVPTPVGGALRLPYGDTLGLPYDGQTFDTHVVIDDADAFTADVRLLCRAGDDGGPSPAEAEAASARLSSAAGGLSFVLTATGVLRRGRDGRLRIAAAD